MRSSIGIRRETRDKTQRRAPLSPAQVRELVQEHGIRVLVQPWMGRVFRDREYQRAGAELSEDLSKANIIFGVKEIASEYLDHGRAYCYFSHTIKGQRENMPMLRTLLEEGCTLIDYELVRNEQGKRIIFFGDYAGYAGMIDTLWALGRRLSSEGVRSPFRAVRYATEYRSLAEAQRQIRAVGREIRRRGLPKDLVPLVFGFTGYGRVSGGAQSVFNLLPFREVEPGQLPELARPGHASRHHLYKVVFRKPDLYRHRKRGKAFSATEFTRHPERYRSLFGAMLPFLTVIVNGIYWEPGSPRLVTRHALAQLFAKRGQPRLRVIGDITCDVRGSIEATVKTTDTSNPVYVYLPHSGKVRDGWEGRGPVLLAVDKLPTELPREASEAFGRALLPYVPALATADFTGRLSELALPEELRRAIIVHKGRLTPRFRKLRGPLRRRR
jgi:saccharopine dehydrogenase (NAD+, L-lysine-forming)